MDIYTDASYAGKKFGLGILFIGEDGEEKKYSFSLRSIDVKEKYPTHSKLSDANIGEGLAILKSLEIVENGNHTLYTDSLTFFELLNELTKTKNHILNIIADKCKDILKNKNVEIRWIKGHCGVYGNVIVDKLSSQSRKNLHEELFLKNIISRIEKGMPLNKCQTRFYSRYIKK